MTWRLLYVPSGREYSVLAELTERRLDGYVPTETIWRGPAHRRVAFKRPFLPTGYLFADLDDYEFAEVRGVRGVIGTLRIIGQTAEETLTLDRLIGQEIGRFVERIRAQERAGDFDHTRRRGEGFEVGQAVKIVKGHFAGHLATITRLKGAHEVVVDVVKMGPMEIAAAKVEALEPA